MASRMVHTCDVCGGEVLTVDDLHSCSLGINGTAWFPKDACESCTKNIKRCCEAAFNQTLAIPAPDSNPMHGIGYGRGDR